MKRMKVLSVFVVLFLALGNVAYSQETYTYESDFDPAVLFQWKALNVEQRGELFFVLAANPDPESPIKQAVIVTRFLYIDGNGEPNTQYILSYAYKLGGEVKYFLLNFETNCYERIYPPEQKTVPQRSGRHDTA